MNLPRSRGFLGHFALELDDGARSFDLVPNTKEAASLASKHPGLGKVQGRELFDGVGGVRMLGVFPSIRNKDRCSLAVSLKVRELSVSWTVPVLMTVAMTGRAALVAH